jgi:hypothetical protein
MINQPDLQQRGRFVEAAGDGLVGSGRPWIARWMVVLCAASDYV